MSGELEYLKVHVPRCLTGFQCTLIKSVESKDGLFEVTYSLNCQCGGDTSSILGYPLKDYNPKYSGRIMVSPLSACCETCEKNTVIIDTDLHGYHGEMDASAKIRGEGPPETFHCLKCDGTSFNNLCGEFWYDGNSFYLFEEPVGFAEYKPGVGIEDYFRNFELRVTCKCRSEDLVKSLDL